MDCQQSTWEEFPFEKSQDTHNNRFPFKCRRLSRARILINLLLPELWAMQPENINSYCSFINWDFEIFCASYLDKFIASILKDLLKRYCRWNYPQKSHVVNFKEEPMSTRDKVYPVPPCKTPSTIWLPQIELHSISRNQRQGPYFFYDFGLFCAVSCCLPPWCCFCCNFQK